MANKVRMVQGFGINDADYYVTSLLDGKRVLCKAYEAWSSMLKRCYSPKNIKVQPTYRGVIVCDEWRSFMSFRCWWIKNHVDGWSLDKDILSDSRVYSPDTCIYVPQWLNTFTIDCLSSRGAYPVGACKRKHLDRFMSSCRNPETGNSEYLGDFSSAIDAHRAWINRKLEIAASLKGEMDCIDQRIYKRVVEIIKRKRESEK